MIVRLSSACVPAALLALGPALGGCSALELDAFVAAPDYDTDGDGWADGEEQQVGTDADNPFAWDFGSGRWPDFTDEAMRDGISGTGYGFGDTIPDQLARDQYGNMVPLYTFYGYVIVLDFVAGWCAPCQDSAEGAQASWVEDRLDGFLIIHHVVDDETNDGDVRRKFPAEWADTYGLELPVLRDDDELAYGGFFGANLTTGEIPFMVVLDDQLRIDSTWFGSGEVELAKARALELIARR